MIKSFLSTFFFPQKNTPNITKLKSLNLVVWDFFAPSYISVAFEGQHNSKAAVGYLVDLKTCCRLWGETDVGSSLYTAEHNFFILCTNLQAAWKVPGQRDGLHGTFRLLSEFACRTFKAHRNVPLSSVVLGKLCIRRSGPYRIIIANIRNEGM